MNATIIDLKAYRLSKSQEDYFPGDYICFRELGGELEEAVVEGVEIRVFGSWQPAQKGFIVGTTAHIYRLRLVDKRIISGTDVLCRRA